MEAERHKRAELLGHAVLLVSRTFLDYMLESAEPFDLDRHPETRAALEAMREEQLEVADRLVDQLLEADPRADLTIAYSPRFTFYNYLATRYALGVLRDELALAREQADALARAAAPDDVIQPLLAETAALLRAHLDRVEALLADSEPRGAA